ncbi:DeoR/GlpR transcriptional regulator [Lactobacillus rhamnosus]|uniref:DeoR/GlpR transcriptional regulator n=2 Tax=Lacticaseibacillus rhamnosus TaxID=47715 RepID=A0A7Y7UKI7_LACRH|nr:DeoR/GlpR transcriptional regulator [Lacticaseibacillus rhamnosus]
MLKKERQEQILGMLNSANKTVTISDLVQVFDVSEDTIRRDLRQMDQKGLLLRVPSGAISNGPDVTNFEHRMKVDTEAKIALVKEAIPLLPKDGVLIIDGSTTNLRLVQNLPTDFTATVITNSPLIAVETSNMRNITTIMLGGLVSKRAESSLGAETIQALTKVHADAYIMGIYNIDPRLGVTFVEQIESQVKNQMANSSDVIIAIATADKVGMRSPFVAAEIQQIDYLVTNSTDNALLRQFQNREVEIVSPNRVQDG